MSFYFYFSQFLHDILYQTVVYGWKMMHNFTERLEKNVFGWSEKQEIDVKNLK